MDRKYFCQKDGSLLWKDKICGLTASGIFRGNFSRRRFRRRGNRRPCRNMLKFLEAVDFKEGDSV